jgi:hypothetical protein
VAVGRDSLLWYAEALVDVSKDMQHEGLQKILERCKLLTSEGVLEQIGTKARGISVSEIECQRSRGFVSTFAIIEGKGLLMT